MSLSFEEVLPLFIRDYEGLDFTPVKVECILMDGGDYQLGEYTWDHENTRLDIVYRHPAGTPGKLYRLQIALERYAGGFGGFVTTLLKLGEVGGV